MKQLANHPCFNPGAKEKYGRVHLPVAPKCNVQCLFCNRKYDCVNESRPGVTSSLLSPAQALHYVERLLDTGRPIAVAGIAGPGDPFANPQETMQTMRLLREKLPELMLCVSSNGLAVAPYIPELAEIGVSHVTLTISALDPDIGAQIYGWVRDGGRVYRGTEGAALMIRRQSEAVRLLKERDIIVKVNSILIPGVNDHHMTAIAMRCRELGVDLHNIIPLCPVAGTPFADLEEQSGKAVSELREACGQYVTQMTHCQRCRADACGLLCEGTTPETMAQLQEISKAPVNPAEHRPYVAVASREGMLVNLHLGEAEAFQIYECAESACALVESRAAPPRGSGESRWDALAGRLSDCRAVLVSSAGPKPTDALQRAGVKVIVMEGLIDQALTDIYGGQPVKAPVRAFRCGKGAGCTGDGGGCG
jgi:nitrogen fixation protein NifB